MYFKEKKKRDSGKRWKIEQGAGFREKGARMPDQDAPSRPREEYGMIRSQYF